MKKPIIFCVDDERIILTSLKVELKSAFGDTHTIETEENALEALEVIKSLHAEGYEIPVVITDYVMPGIKGDVLLFQLHDDYPRMKKIMLTGQATMEGVTSAVNHADLYRYISKPWEPQDLVITVKEALRSYRQIATLEAQNAELQLITDNLRQQLRERESLLQEIHHRTKNNMNVIISLLNLQASEHGDESLARAFSKVSSRIYSMSAVHEQLYGQKNFDRINLNPYVKMLANKIILNHSVNPLEIELVNQAEDIELSLEQAVPFGLALHEILSNAVIHGLNTGRPGKLEIRIERQAGDIVIIVRNDGFPISEPLDLDTVKSLGLYLVRLLVKDQLAGQIALETEPKTCFTMRWPLNTE
jgi:two-component sensor histidine kinase